ncbi:MAG TPA: hypothetical protein PK568_04655, partial [Bacillota bacterium]|nr:hypothetical protein [Bacillota bacterium]
MAQRQYTFSRAGTLYPENLWQRSLKAPLIFSFKPELGNNPIYNLYYKSARLGLHYEPILTLYDNYVKMEQGR